MMKKSFIFPTLFLAIFSVNASVASCWHNEIMNIALMQANFLLIQDNLRMQQQMSELRQEILQMRQQMSEMHRISAFQQQASQGIVRTMTIFLQGNRQISDSLYLLQENFNRSELLFNEERHKFEQELADIKARIAILQSATTSNTNKNGNN